jgi:hypothetical protein
MTTIGLVAMSVLQVGDCPVFIYQTLEVLDIKLMN